jgi:hypothetical protein
MRRLCFTCEREQTSEFECRACGELECADCCDATSELCAACAYEVEAARSLNEVLMRKAG